MKNFVAGSREKRVILVVDDDEHHRSALGEILRGQGFRVLYAGDGRVALDCLLRAEREPSLILLDMNMPVMSGPEMITVLQGNAQLARIPIVLITGDTRSMPIPNGRVVARLNKPCAIDALLAIVQRHVAPAETANGGTVLCS